VPPSAAADPAALPWLDSAWRSASCADLKESHCAIVDQHDQNTTLYEQSDRIRDCPLLVVVKCNTLVAALM
jgi:hypothetical protein